MRLYTYFAPPMGLALALAVFCQFNRPIDVRAAGVISFSPAFTDDASTGISETKTYTHLISGGQAQSGLFDTGGGGLNFAELDFNSTPPNFSWSVSTGAKNQVTDNNNDWDPVGGLVDTVSLLNDFSYNSGSGANNSQTYTLSGLTPGETYDTRLYIRIWDDDSPSDRPIDFTFTNGLDVDSLLNLLEDSPSTVLGAGATDDDAYYISYQFLAQGNTLEIDAEHTAAATFHLYALTNELVPPIPEPASVAIWSLLGIGVLFGWHCRRKTGASQS